MSQAHSKTLRENEELKRAKSQLTQVKEELALVKKDEEELSQAYAKVHKENAVLKTRLARLLEQVHGNYVSGDAHLTSDGDYQSD